MKSEEEEWGLCIWRVIRGWTGLSPLKCWRPIHRDAQQRERLKREARAAARLSHPGIATVYSLEEFDDSVCIVSEYVQGPTLGQIMSKGRLPFDQVLDISIQIARGLVAAHEEGIVHRDLKPENVIRTESGTVKILDFGLARVEPRDRGGFQSAPDAIGRIPWNACLCFT